MKSAKVTLIQNPSKSKYIDVNLSCPLMVCFAVTKRCNYTCAHCLASSDKYSNHGMHIDEITKLLKILWRYGVKKIDMSGGEPFMRPDIIDILEFARKLSFEVVITTHGGFINKKIAEQLSRLRVLVHVSLDGPLEVNDRLREKGSYNRAVSAIKLLLESRVQVKIISTIQRSNHLILPEIVTIANTLTVQTVYFNIVCDLGRAHDIADSVCLTPEEYATVVKQVANLRSNNISNSLNIEFKQAERNGVFIDHNGDVLKRASRESEIALLGNLFVDDFSELWKKSGSDHLLHLLQYFRHPILYKTRL